MAVSADSTPMAAWLWNWPPVMLPINAFCFSASAWARLSENDPLAENAAPCDFSLPAQGPAVSAVTAVPIAKTAIASTAVAPDFRNFVTTPNGSYVSGYWTVLGTWTSTSGSSLGNGYGVRSGSPGASLLYQEDAPLGDMQVDVVMSPEKNEGQGFGIPGSPLDGNTQNADIYIKYDPRTQNGYSLRWWRTTQSAVKCMFQLYQHIGGVGSPVSPAQVLTGVFKPNTYMTLSIMGSTFKVTAHNDVDADALSLQATVVPNLYGGAGTRWSGSTPPGNGNVYSSFRISYPGAEK
jgi:hypothetical protein